MGKPQAIILTFINGGDFRINNLSVAEIVHRHYPQDSHFKIAPRKTDHPSFTVNVYDTDEMKARELYDDLTSTLPMITWKVAIYDHSIMPPDHW